MTLYGAGEADEKRPKVKKCPNCLVVYDGMADNCAVCKEAFLLVDAKLELMLD